MIRKRIYHAITYAVLIACTLSACSEDSLSPIDELGTTIYDPTNAEEGTANALINTFYEKYGSRILYDFNASDLAFGWSSSKPYWYAPVKKEYSHYIKDVTTFLTEKAFQEYPASFIKKFLPYRIFLVDSICSTTTYDKSKLQDVQELNTHGIALSRIGIEMDKWNNDNWSTLQGKLVDIVMNSVYTPYKSNPKLVEFDQLKPQYVWYLEFEDDPEGYFTNTEYPLYANGFAGGLIYPDDEMIVPPTSTANDLGYFISLILKTPKEKMDKIFSRFNLVKQRSFLIASFIKEELEMNPIAMQNSSCPNDPLPATYFDK